MNRKPVNGTSQHSHGTGLKAIVLAVFLLAGCQGQTSEGQVADSASTSQPAATQGRTGTVSETMNSGGYTYIQVDTGSEKFWVAAPEYVVKVGDHVVVPEGMAMPDYHSRTLDRDFDLVYFVGNVQVGDEPASPAIPSMPPGHPSSEATAAPVEEIEVTRADGGYSISEIYARQSDLANTTVTVRGKVVKYNDQIMGTNWLHIQDGTGAAGSNDLTVTTQQTVKIGDTVLVTGTLTTGKDFGSGYSYDVIIEDAEIVVE